MWNLAPQGQFELISQYLPSPMKIEFKVHVMSADYGGKKTDKTLDENSIMSAGKKNENTLGTLREETMEPLNLNCVVSSSSTDFMMHKTQCCVFPAGYK